MSSFTRFDTSLKLEYLLQHDKKYAAREYWKVLESFKFYSDTIFPEGRVWIEVPVGFISDGASVPRFLWSWLPPFSKYGQAAVLHDYLVEGGEVMFAEDPKAYEARFKVTRAQADRIFLEAMEVLGVGRLKRYIMYFGVRAWAILTGKK